VNPRHYNLALEGKPRSAEIPSKQLLWLQVLQQQLVWREVGVHITSECKIAKKTKKREKPLSYLKFQVWPSAPMLLEEIVA